MKRKKVSTPAQWILGLVLAIFLLSSAIILVVNLRPLYYSLIEPLKLTESSGLSPEQIRANYDALIDYNSIFYSGALHFPDLAMSEEGRIHFVEVKEIFVFLQIAAMVSGVLLLFFGASKLRKKEPQFLKTGALLSLLIPAIVSALIAVNWDNAFVLMHKLLFDNDYWIFDAAKDPVIHILPDTFFLYSALAIVGLVLLGAVFSYFLYRLILRKDRSFDN
ncbi:MAG: TIGR01906 family membrane protein [Tissierellia bacterium]|nr:TIGR01906 family membrane protein [Tissierellia bacterium]